LKNVIYLDATDDNAGNNAHYELLEKFGWQGQSASCKYLT